MNVFSLNAFVDGRRHEMTSNFNFYRNVAHESLHILTGNDIKIYFRSAANRINVKKCSSHIQSVLKLFTVFERVIQVLHCFLWTFLFLGPKSGAQMNLPSAMHYING